MVNDCAPAVALTVPPGQVVVALGVGAIIKPLVELPQDVVPVPVEESVRETLSSWLELVLVNVIVKVEIPPGLTMFG